MAHIQMKDIDSEEDLIAFGNDFFQKSAKARRKQEQQWLLNLAYLAGDQLVNINKVTGKLDRIKVEYDPDWIIRTVDNRVLPIYRAITAKLTKNKPFPSAKAHSQEEGDIQAARAAEKLEEHHWNMLELDDIHPEMVGWLAAAGNCFYKQFWNEKKGDKIPVSESIDVEAGLNGDGTPRLKVHEENIDAIPLGDTDLILRSPFNIYPQPGKTKLKDMSILGDAEIMDVSEIQELYGVEVAPEKDTELVVMQSSIDEIIEAGKVSGGQSLNTATVKELYILPNKKFPKGIMFRWAGNKLLGKPQSCSEMPFVHFGLIFIPGKFWHKGVIDDIIPLQKRWNQLLSKIEMHNDYYNDPPTIIDPNIINADDWTNEPGLLLESEMPGADVRSAAHILPVPKLDSSIFNELEILDQQFEVVSVLSKVSFGKDTPNAKSGIAINFLQEKDDDIVSPLIKNIEAGYAKVFKRDFKLCQDNYEEDRGFAIVGEDNKIEWIEFTKANLEANIDIGVEPGSAMPRSKVAQQAMVLDMLHEGFFTDPRTGRPDYAKALKYMEFGSVDEIYEDASLDSNHAKRVIEKLKDGIMVEPQDFWNHEAHIYEVNRFRKTAEFEEMDPEIQELFNNYVSMCQQFIQAKRPQNEPQQAQNTAQGGMPTEEEITSFLQILAQERPDVIQQLDAMQPEQRQQAILQLMSQQSQLGSG